MIQSSYMERNRVISLSIVTGNGDSMMQKPTRLSGHANILREVFTPTPQSSGTAAGKRAGSTPQLGLTLQEGRGHPAPSTVQICPGPGRKPDHSHFATQPITSALQDYIPTIGQILSWPAAHYIKHFIIFFNQFYKA